jgi:hypothetical protein
MMPDEKNADLIQLKEELKNELREEFLRNSPKPSIGSFTHFFIKNRVAVCVGIILFLFGLAFGSWIGEGDRHPWGDRSFERIGPQHGIEGSNRWPR